MTDWMALKSGSDVRGTAVGDNAALTADIAQALGMAFAQWVAAKKNKPVQALKIALGRDSRITGPALLQAVSDGICRSGASVSDFGMCTTPAMYMSTGHVHVHRHPGFRCRRRSHDYRQPSSLGQERTQVFHI